MVHRYTINKRPLLDSNGNLLTGITTTWVSGVTYTTIPNTNQTTRTVIDQTVDIKNITIPIKIEFQPMDNSELISEWVKEQKLKAINSVIDSEKTNYKFEEFSGATINFRFLNSGVYGGSYADAGFEQDELTLNRFTKSYFRLYFYDGNDENANLMMTEDFLLETPQFATDTIQFKLDKIIWERLDSVMVNSYNNRDLYVEARFFNAKTGKIIRFLTIPTSYTTPITINQYRNVSNLDWRYSKITMVNPNNSNGDYFFRLNINGGTTKNNITFSQLDLT